MPSSNEMRGRCSQKAMLVLDVSATMLMGLLFSGTGLGYPASRVRGTW